MTFVRFIKKQNLCFTTFISPKLKIPHLARLYCVLAYSFNHRTLKIDH